MANGELLNMSAEEAMLRSDLSEAISSQVQTLMAELGPGSREHPPSVTLEGIIEDDDDLDTITLDLIHQGGSFITIAAGGLSYLISKSRVSNTDTGKFASDDEIEDIRDWLRYTRWVNAMTYRPEWIIYNEHSLEDTFPQDRIGINIWLAIGEAQHYLDEHYRRITKPRGENVVKRLGAMLTGLRYGIWPVYTKASGSVSEAREDS